MSPKHKNLTELTKSQKLTEVDKIWIPRERLESELTSEKQLSLDQTLKKYGVLYPLIVKKEEKEGKPYKLVCGKQRLQALRKQGVKEVGVVIASSEIPDLVYQVLENYSRGEIKTMELINHFALHYGENWDIGEVKNLTGLQKSAAYQYQKLGKLLLSLDEDSVLCTLSMPMGINRTLWNRYEPDEDKFIEALKAVKRAGFSGRQVRGLISSRKLNGFVKGKRHCLMCGRFSETRKIRLCPECWDKYVAEFGEPLTKSDIRELLEEEHENNNTQ